MTIIEIDSRYKIHPFVAESNVHSMLCSTTHRPTGEWIGWGTGYAKIPKGHPWYGMDYDTIHEEFDIRVHGGLTYSDWAIVGHGVDNIEDVLHKKYWMVGFDTAHAGDNSTKWQDVDVMHETFKLCKQAEEIWLKQLIKKKKQKRK